MYQYTDFDRQFVRARAAQFRDQLERNLAGELADDEFRPLRLQNGWYVQRHAPMLRVAIPYGELASRQLRQLGRMATELDRDFLHFTTRQNAQFNWIPLDEVGRRDGPAGRCRHARHPDLAATASATSPPTCSPASRPTRSSTRARTASCCASGARCSPSSRSCRASSRSPSAARWKTAPRSPGTTSACSCCKNDAGEVGFKVLVGGGMGRTPIIGSVATEFLPWNQILVYIEAIVRVYNRFGRRDNAYKARIKILVKAEGQKFFDQVNEEFRKILADDVGGTAHIIPQAEFDRVAAFFTRPEKVRPAIGGFDPNRTGAAPVPFLRWLDRNVHAHQVEGYRAVTLSLKRPGLPPGDVTSAQMEAAADDGRPLLAGRAARVARPEPDAAVGARGRPARRLARRAGSRLRHAQHRPADRHDRLPRRRPVRARQRPLDPDRRRHHRAVRRPRRAARPRRHRPAHQRLHELLRPPPHAATSASSASTRTATSGTRSASAAPTAATLSGASVPAKVIGPSFAAEEVPAVIQALIDTYRAQRAANERFVDTARRIGIAPFRQATDAVRRETAVAA